jgi:phage-related protein
MLGLGCLAAGVGVLAFATGINILAETGPAGAEALKAIVMAMVELIPYALAALAVGIIAFAKVIGDGAPVIAESFMKVFTAMLDTAVQMTPKVIDAGLKLILGLLKAIGDNIQKIVEAGINVIVGFLKGIASKIGDIIDTAFKVIIAFINGLADAIDKNHIALYEAVRKLVTAIGDAIIDFIPYMVSMGSDMIKGFIEGVKSMAGALWDAAKGVVSGAVDGIKNFLGIHSPSRVFAEIGMFSALGMANGLRDFGGTVVKEAKNVGINAVDTMGNAISNISDVVNSNMDTNPTIRPVLDLSDVQNGSKRLSSLMDKNGIYTLNSSVGLANVASSGMSYNKVSSIDSPSTNDVVQPINQTQQNTFNITGSNPKEIADEVSRILQKQVERSETVWA